MRSSDGGDIRYAFVNGFNYGTSYQRPATPRQAEAWLRSWNPNCYLSGGCIDAFCNGSEDGAIGDSWRIERAFDIRGGE